MTIETFSLTGSATLSFVEDMDAFRTPETKFFAEAVDAVLYAVEKLPIDQLWTASIVDGKGTRIGSAQIRSIYDAL